MTKPIPIGFPVGGGKTDRAEGARRSPDADAWSRFDAEIEKGIDAADRGDLYDAEDVFSDVKARLRAEAAKKRG